jgi:hypothetical protein
LNRSGDAVFARYVLGHLPYLPSISKRTLTIT